MYTQTAKLIGLLRISIHLKKLECFISIITGLISLVSHPLLEAGYAVFLNQNKKVHFLNLCPDRCCCGGVNFGVIIIRYLRLCNVLSNSFYEFCPGIDDRQISRTLLHCLRSCYVTQSQESCKVTRSKF
jgi:hypothetical protein